MISNLQYVSQGETPEEHLKNIQRMCAAGAEWIQLRLKKQPYMTVLETARAARQICSEFSVRLIINDFPGIAEKVDADGVHLGKKDLCPLTARNLMSSGKIIGGTANTLEDCESLCEKQVDYIGLGPYRFTTTKKDLSPLLDAEAYRLFVSSLHTGGRSVPVIAIGGITSADIPSLIESGVHGVAISSWLTAHPKPEKVLQEIHQHFLKQ